MEDKIVYVYNYKDLIMITRTESGEWFFEYTRSKIMQKTNKNRKKEGKRPYGINPTDSFSTGVITGWIAYKLTEQCKLSYGDK